MSDHLLRDLADPMYRYQQTAMKVKHWQEKEIYLPMRLLPHFGEIRWEKPETVNMVYCLGCGKNIEMVGKLWIWNDTPWHPAQGTLWIFCPECFYVFSQRQSINYNEKTT